MFSAMKLASVFLLVHLFARSSARSSLELDAVTNLKERPVMKVVRLLQDTKAQLERELEDDKAVNELMTCWCETGVKEKTAAIDTANAKIAQLTASMAADAAKIEELTEKRRETLDEVNADHKALMDATAMRIKENKEFQASETDYLEAIAAAKQAIIVLSKHNRADFAQLKSVARRLLNARVSQLLDHSSELSRGRVSTLRSFLRNAESATSFLSIPGFQSYAPQSGQIFGILTQMKEEFEVNLSEAQKAEAKAKAEYEELKAAKEDEIETGRKSIVTMDSAIAKLQEKYAQEAKELGNTKDQLALDTEFLQNLQKKCATHDADFEKRVKDRMTELAAVDDTIKILNSDESFEAFDKMVAPTPMFLQSSLDQQQLRQRVLSVLQRSPSLATSPHMVLLSASVQLDEFTKIKGLIDKMVIELQKQQKDEIAHRDMCTKDLNENERSTAAAYDAKESLEAEIADLEKSIEQLTKDIDASKTAVSETKEQMKRASETREAENADFQVTVNDHRIMSMILTKAIDRMKQVYALLQQSARKPGAPHIQTSGTHTDPGNGPAKFKKYAQNAGGGRVVSMLEEILADTRKTEDQAMASEQDSQAAYEGFMKDANKSITQLTKSISEMNGAKATAKQNLSIANGNLAATMKEIESLHETKADLHKACDYILKNFEVRQSNRAAEIEALNEAKAILSGAK